jgi:plastocyanin
VRQGKLVIATVSLALAVVLGNGSPAGASSSHTVQIKDIDFHPRTITVRRGDSVRWVWLDGSTPHNVRSRGALRFRGSPTKTRGTYTVRFRHAGTYRYVCTIHFNMKGRVLVR